MPDEEEVQGEEPTIPGLLVGDGTVIPLANSSVDVPTYYFDAVQGASVGPWVTKITFVESFAPLKNGDDQRGRAVFNLAFPTPQLKAIGELFVKLSNELDLALDTLVSDGQ